MRAIVVGPSRLMGGFKDAFNSPAITALAVMGAGALLVGLGWLGVRMLMRRRRRVERRWAYSKLPGDGRAEMLRIHRRVEKLLKRKGVQPRRPGQTLREYTQAATKQLRGMESHLVWFTQAVWEAAYKVGTFPAQTVPEARSRFALLKTALG